MLIFFNDSGFASQMSELKVVFVDRVNFTIWVVRKSDGSNTDLQYFGSIEPILFGILYTIQITPEVKFINGERVWNKEVHARFFPNTSYKETWDPRYYSTTQVAKSEECSRWMRFDLEFHLQSLVPTIPSMQYAHLVRQGAEGLENLVYKIGGVDPIALMSAGGSPDLVRDAWNIRMLTTLMKQHHRSPWLNDDECAPFTVEDEKTNESFARLFERDVIVQRNVGTEDEPKFEIALSWAAKFDSSIHTMTCNYERGHIPASIKNAKKPPRDANAGDPHLRLDHEIDKRRLPLSMASNVKWINVEPVINKAVRVKNLKAAQDYIKTNLGPKGGLSLMYFSESGLHGIVVPGEWTCFDGNKAIVVVKLCIHNPSMFAVNGEEIDRKDAFAKYKFVGRQRWEDIHKFDGVDAPDVVVGLFFLRHELDWCAWIDKIFDKSKKILVFINDNRA